MKMRNWWRAMAYGALCVWGLWALFPVYIMFITSLKNRVDTFSIPFKFIFIPTISNYQYAFGHEFLRYFVNSIIVTLAATFLTLAVAVFAAHACFRYDYFIIRVIRQTFMLFRMMSPAIIAIPMFLLWRQYGLLGRLEGLIIAYTGMCIPFAVWIIGSYLLDIPKEIEESAIIDGCSETKLLIRIILPLLKPGLAVAGIFCFRLCWNEFILALVLTTRATQTLPIALSLHFTEMGVLWGELNALATVVAVPAFLFAFLAARHIIEGLTAGAVKG